MAIEVKVPSAGESVSEVEIGEWLKSEGDSVAADENLVVLETDKASMEVPAPAAGKLVRILKQAGDAVAVGDTIAEIEPGDAPRGGEKSAGSDEDETPAKTQPAPEAEPKPEPKPETPTAETPADAPESKEADAEPSSVPHDEVTRVMPAARRIIREHGLNTDVLQGTGPGGRVLKEDVQRHLDSSDAAEPRAADAEDEDVVPMSLLRRKVAERLVHAQQTAALLTTFNEVDMSGVLALRRAHGEAFKERHGIKLGFMSFFVKAAVDALRAVPEVNAEIREKSMVLHRRCHIGVAVGGGKGLVVPVLRDADALSFAEVEQAIADFAKRAADSQLEPDELQGGTFTISNGGIYGSLLSTPIVNPPQSGILGMHSMQDRPVAIDGEVVIRPMMYIALTYDHRIVDGRGAVTFLKRIKDCIENPARMLLEV